MGALRRRVQARAKITGDAISVDPYLPWTKLGVAAVAVFYPVWTILAVAMTVQSVHTLVNRWQRTRWHHPISVSISGANT
jgi:hypothetical protein